MTPEQQKLAADNHGLIIKFLIKHRLDIDEYYGDMAIAFCYAARAYDPARNRAFSTYAYRCMQNHLIRMWQNEGRAKRIPWSMIASLDELVFDGDEASARINNVKAVVGMNGRDETSIVVREFLDSLTDVEAHIVSSYMAGYKSPTIAKELGMTKQNVHLIKKRIQKKWLQYAA